jgi:hypothetical protein
MGARGEIFDRLTLLRAPVPKDIVPDPVLIPVDAKHGSAMFAVKRSYVREILQKAGAEVSIGNTHTFDLPKAPRRDDDEGGEGSRRMVRPFDDDPSGNRSANSYAPLTLL